MSGLGERLGGRAQHGRWAAAALGVVAVVELAALPHRLLLDWLEELRPGASPVGQPAERARFLLSFLGLTVARFAARAVVALVGLAIVRSTPWWPLLLWSGAVVVGVMWAWGAPLVVPAIVDGAVPLERSDVRDMVAGLAGQAGVSPPSVLVSRRSPGDDSDTGRGVGEGAYVLGLGGTRRIVLDAAVLDGPARDLQVVTAHELAHLRLRHSRASLMLTAAIFAVGLAATWAVGRLAHVDTGAPAAIPLWLLMFEATGLVGALSLAAWSRRQEHAADAFAATLLGSASVTDHLRRHCIASGAELEPAGWARWVSPHPAPADRLT
jgi:STE24 endopeptidase